MKNRGKKGKQTKKNKKRNSSSRNQQNNTFKEMDSGDFAGRIYPPPRKREKIIKNILSIPEEKRTSLQFWMLGALTLYEGILDEDDFQINEGITALTSSANHPTPHFAGAQDLAVILLIRGLDSLALPYAQKATQIDTANRDALSLLGWVYIGLGQRDNAIETLKKASSLDDSLPADKNILRDLEKNEDLKKLRSKLVFNIVNVKSLTMQDGDSEELNKILRFTFKQILKKEPENIQAKYGLAQTYYAMHDFSKSEPILKNLIGDDPKHADALTTLALICKKTDRTEDAIDYYRKAVSADKLHVLANSNLASYLQDTGDYKEARVLLENALDGDKEDGNYFLALDLYGNNIGYLDEDFEKEKEYHVMSIDKNPNYPLAKLNYIISLICLGDVFNLKKAWSKYQNDIVSNSTKNLPGKPYQTENLASVEIINKFIKLIKIPSKDPFHWMMVANLLRKAFGWKAARTYIRKSWSFRKMVLPEEKEELYSALSMLASNANDHELALEINLEGEKLKLGDVDVFTSNAAVELGLLGKHNDAIAKASTMSMDSDRSYTVMGNILNGAGKKEEALFNYLEAIEKDIPFLLPFENGIPIAIQLVDWKSLDKFLKKLEEKWKDNAKATTLKSLILFHKGLPREAAVTLSKILIKDGELILPDFDDPEPANQSPEGIYEDEEDLSMLGKKDPNEEGYRHHYLLGLAYLACKEFTSLESLLRWAFEEEKCADGDWNVLYAQYMFEGPENIKRSLEIVEGMTSQPPPLVTAALCKLYQKENEEAQKLAKQALSDEFKNYTFNHPIANPYSIAHAILGEVHNINKNFPEALDELNESLKIDPFNYLAHHFNVMVLYNMREFDQAASAAEKGLSLCPGKIFLVNPLVDYHLEKNNFDQAQQILEEQRKYLLSHGEGENTALLSERITKKRNKEKSPEEKILYEIQSGETAKCEFKSSLRWNLKVKKIDKQMTHACLKTIAGFLNTDGGTLYIGVSDEGEILGIKHDDYKNNDQFLNNLFNFIDNALGKHAAALIKADIVPIKNKSICRVDCPKSTKPAYLKWDKTEDLFVRTGPSTRSLAASEIVDYIQTHFQFGN